MPCLTDHMALTSKFCPDCGWRQCVQREPGEIAAMRQRALDAIQTSPDGGGVLGIVLMMSVSATLGWVEGAMTDEQFLQILHVPKARVSPSR